MKVETVWCKKIQRKYISKNIYVIVAQNQTLLLRKFKFGPPGINGSNFIQYIIVIAYALDEREETHIHVRSRQ